jgi:hypothetical protein
MMRLPRNKCERRGQYRRATLDVDLRLILAASCPKITFPARSWTFAA